LISEQPLQDYFLHRKNVPTVNPAVHVHAPRASTRLRVSVGSSRMSCLTDS
jgi:hypothetical protein